MRALTPDRENGSCKKRQRKRKKREKLGAGSVKLPKFFCCRMNSLKLSDDTDSVIGGVRTSYFGTNYFLKIAKNTLHSIARTPKA